MTPVIASHAGSTWLTGLTGLSPCVGPVANGNADRAVDGVVDGRRAVRIAEQVHHDQIARAACFSALVAEPAGRREVGEEDARPVARLGDQAGDQLLALRTAGIDGDRALALVQADPVEALAVGGERPASRVETALQRIEADDVGALLRQRHAAQRRRDERRAFDDAQTLENSVHGVLPGEACLY